MIGEKFRWSNGVQLTREYVFVAHHIFDHCLDQVLEKNPQLEDSYRKQVRRIKSNPDTGKRMKYAPQPLAGRLRKVKIGGRKGYSLCYVVFEQFQAVLGVFITPEDRSKVDYRNFPWETLVEAAEDFQKKDLSKLRIVEDK